MALISKVRRGYGKIYHCALTGMFVLCLTASVLLTGSVKPSSAKSDTSSVRPRKVSFDVVRDQGKSDLGGQPLKVVQSTPSLKKGGSPRKFILGKEAGFFPSL